MKEKPFDQICEKTRFRINFRSKTTSNYKPLLQNFQKCLGMSAIIKFYFSTSHLKAHNCIKKLLAYYQVLSMLSMN